MKKAIKISLSLLLVVILLATGGLILLLRKSLPQTEGKLQLSILSAPVKVLRDEAGVPSILAENELDLYRAQGFVQAQDRLFQMDLARRQAGGMLSEVIGPAALNTDKKFLTFSLRRAAEASFGVYSAEGKAILEAFAEGVNAYRSMAIEKGTLPYEFTLLGYQPTEWTPIDSLSIGKYMAYDLNYKFDYQAMNNWVLNNLGEEALKDFLPDNFYDNPDNLEILEANRKVSASLNPLSANLARPADNNGSNNWVIAGNRSVTDQPILADDPHLSLGVPSIWYQMHLVAGDLNVSGVIFAGIPGIILGHNKDIAWGVTNVGPLVQDLYIERVNPDNAHQFEYDGKYYDAEVVEHNIKIKGQEDEKFEVLYTKNGVVIDHLMKSLDNTHRFSMQWTALAPTKELEAVLNFNRSKNWADFEKALLDFRAPAQNFVVADKEGNIAFKANGDIPFRKKGDFALPVPGYSSEYGWDGFIPYNQLPRSVNPASGVLFSANIKTIANYDLHPISHTWAQAHRSNRIEEFLSEDRKFSYEDMMALQNDYLDHSAVEFLDAFLANTTEMSEEVRNLLSDWNKKADKDLAAPLIWETWQRELQKTLFLEQMGESAFEFLPSKGYFSDNILRKVFAGGTSVYIEKAGGIEKVLNDSLANTLTFLSNKFDKKVSEWKWGKQHNSQFLHPIGKSNNILGFFLNTKSTATHGNAVTVLAARNTDEGIIDHGASWRFVYDFASESGYHVVAPGQAGHFMSPFYNNQLDNWNEGNYNKKDTLNISEKYSLILEP